MKTVIIEATNHPDGYNYGKFLLGRMDEEWERRTALAEVAKEITEEVGGEGSWSGEGRPHCAPLLSQLGWGRNHLWVLDLQTGEGAFFNPGGLASADLDKHRIWVCPMFEPFLEWVYRQDLSDLDALPRVVQLDAPSSFAGYRRKGPEQ